jgi:transcriptional regulator with XRE-family HTH domain
VHDPNPDRATAQLRAIGLQIRAARKEAGLSQAALGDAIGRDHKTISRWENAHRIPNLLDLIRIAHALNTPLSDLVR